ncbi:ferritin [cyanobacterium TDX16]|nr:ferritin [cyanobacterium TDX16]
MTAGSTTLHEENLPPDVIDRHRAIVSMMEELEAVDWYDQRAAASSDEDLKEILGHNRDEEKEHFAMTLEWLRRRDPKMDEHLRTYLFTDGQNILEVEEEAEHGGGEGGPAAAPTSGLQLGSLRDESEGTL